MNLVIIFLYYYIYLFLLFSSFYIYCLLLIFTEDLLDSFITFQILVFIIVIIFYLVLEINLLFSTLISLIIL